MTCYENSEEKKNENGGEENKQESKNPEDDERIDPGTARNTEEPQGTPLTQLYISNVLTTGIMSEWVISTIEENLANPKVPRSV